MRPRPGAQRHRGRLLRVHGAQLPHLAARVLGPDGPSLPRAGGRGARRRGPDQQQSPLVSSRRRWRASRRREPSRARRHALRPGGRTRSTPTASTYRAPTRSNCDYDHNGKINYADADEHAERSRAARPSAGTRRAPTTSSAASTPQYASQNDFEFIVTDSSNRLRRVASRPTPRRPILFDPVASRGQTIRAFTGVVSYFSGGSQFTLNARCEDDVITDPNGCPTDTVERGLRPPANLVATSTQTRSESKHSGASALEGPIRCDPSVYSPPCRRSPASRSLARRRSRSSRRLRCRRRPCRRRPPAPPPPPPARRAAAAPRALDGAPAPRARAAAGLSAQLRPTAGATPRPGLRRAWARPARAPSASRRPGTRPGDFMDTRLSWTFGDDDFLHPTGQLIPLSPTLLDRRPPAVPPLLRRAELALRRPREPHAPRDVQEDAGLHPAPDDRGGGRPALRSRRARGEHGQPQHGALRRRLVPPPLLQHGTRTRAKASRRRSSRSTPTASASATSTTSRGAARPRTSTSRSSPASRGARRASRSSTTRSASTRSAASRRRRSSSRSRS